MTKEEKDIPTSITTDMFTQLILEKKAIEKDLKQNPIDMDMIKALILGLLLGIDKNPDEKDKLMEDLIKVFAPKPKTGHWIKVTNGRGGHECDICHRYAPSYQDGDEYLTNYCPNCGAKMAVSEK